MQVGQANYDETPLDGSVFTGDVIETTVEYTPFSMLGKATSRRVAVRAMVYKAPFVTVGANVPRRDEDGKIMWHHVNGSPKKEQMIRKPDTVKEEFYYLCPVGQTGLLEIVRLPDDWKEVQARERNQVAALTNDSLLARQQEFEAQMAERERALAEQQERILRAVKALGVKEEDLGLAPAANTPPQPQTVKPQQQGQNGRR